MVPGVGPTTILLWPPYAKGQKKLPLQINGQGNQGRDFIYIDDIVQAFLLAGFHEKSKSGKVYNIGSGQITTLKKLLLRSNE